MSVAIIGIIALVVATLGIALYFLLNTKACKKHKTQDECKEPCKWDTYGDKCIGEKDTLTAAPTPTGCSTYTTQDTCVSPCTWNSSTSVCGSSITPSGGGGSTDYVEGRYVRLESPNEMRINEILVYDEKGDLISHNNPDVTSSASSTQPGWGPTSKLYDFEIADYPFHTGFGTSEFVQLDMGKVVKISKVVIVNQSYHREVMPKIDVNVIKIMGGTDNVVAQATIDVDDENDAASKPIFVFKPKNQTIVQPSTIAVDKPIKARYVKIRSKNGKFLVLGEVEVYNTRGENIALNKPVTMSSTQHQNWGAQRLVDGDNDTEAHTLATDTGPDWMLVDLGTIHSISGVRIYARTAHEGTYKSHANRIWVEFADYDNNFIISTTRTDGDHTWYDFKLKDIPSNWTTSSQ